MKKKYILQTLILLFFVFTATAQQGINYKAIINDANGDALINTMVTVQFTILENGATDVYKETHNPTTNVNGIIIVNIGEGTLLSGDFNTIDWGSNPHFLKTEIDKGDGLTDMGTTEFKTVPYALHAKTAESATGTMPEDANSGDMAYYDGTNWTKIKAPIHPSEDNMVLTFCDGIPAWTYDGDCSYVNRDAEYKYGGVVFYVFQPNDNGYIAGETHGLVCAVKDQSDAAEWGCVGIDIDGASMDGIGYGAQNTIDIEAGCTTLGTAADICANLVLNGYDDWFLPSRYELQLMCTYKYIIDEIAIANGGFAFSYNWENYWSSSTDRSYNTVAKSIGFTNNYYYKDDRASTNRVRAVRAF